MPDSAKNEADVLPSPAPPSSAPFPFDLFCQKCGYNLRGLTADRCPECGRSLEGLRSPVSRIPWTHRRELGRFRAYWKTVAFVMFRQSDFCDEIARPVSFRDSQSFRWTTVLYALVPVLLGTSFAYLPIADELPALPSTVLEDAAVAAAEAVWPFAVFQGLLLVYLAAATGVPSYFFHPRRMAVELQNRAVALSYYCAAPLALTLVPTFLVFEAYLHSRNEFVGETLVLAAGAVLAFYLLAWWLCPIRLSRRLMPDRPMRAWAIAVVVPLLWLVLALLILLAIPAVIFYVLLVIASFR